MILPTFDWDSEFDNFLNSLRLKETTQVIAMINKIEEHGLQIAINAPIIGPTEKPINRCIKFFIDTPYMWNFV